MAKYTSKISKARLAAYLLLWNTSSAEAQSSSTNPNITEVTSTTTFSGSTITEIYTPTSIVIDGLESPVTSATTITTTNSAGETVAVAVVVGAGVVAAGAFAAWLFEPVPGAPAAPSLPPPYPTKTQDNTETPTSTTPTTSTSTSSSTAAACPFPTSGYRLKFAPAQEQPQWTAVLPSPSTVSSFSPKCTQQGENRQLLRGADPGYVNALSQVFCKGDLTKDRSAILGQQDLPSDSRWKNPQLNSVRVKFDFDYKLSNPGCQQNCLDAHSQISTACQFNSHALYGGGSLEQGCGTYNLMVDADPRTTLTCNSIPDPINTSYEYRDAAIVSINNFCTAQDGKVLKQNDDSSFIIEKGFSATYSKKCTGSGTYTIDKDLCVSYLTKALDSCDTTTTMYKHGGIVTDIDNCGVFAFHPFGYDAFACYPDNQDAGFISGTHVQVSPQVAKDAINQFCDRNGDGQKYTLDPNNIPTGFSQDTCTQPGMAFCGYYYNNDGSRAEEGSVGNMFIRMEAKFVDAGDKYECSVRQEYEIHGDRCHQELNKVIGVEPKGSCVGSDPSKLDLGSFLESGDKGCVLWNMWAVKTV